MKKTAKIVLMSVVTIAMCISLIASATFALFTSESSVNITVSSGKVEILSTAMLVDAWSASASNNQERESIYNAETDGDTATFLNGGSATAIDGDVTLENITPGDGVKLEINIINNSNVKIKYTINAAKTQDDGLFDGLTFSATQGEDGADLSTDWAVADPKADIDNIYVTIELPVDKGNEYQEKTCAFVVVVQAIQANGQIATPVDADNFAKELLTGTDPVVQFSGDIAKDSSWVPLEATQNSQTIDFNGHTFISDSNATKAFTVGFYNAKETQEDSTLTKYTHDADIYLRNGTIDASACSTSYGFAIQGHPSSIYDAMSEEEQANAAQLTVHLDNMHIKASYGAFSINALNRGITIIANNCTFEGIAESGTGAYLPADCTYIFNKCTFVGYSGAVLRAGHITFNDCTIQATDIGGEYWDIDAGNYYPAGTYGANGSALQIVNSSDSYADLYLTINGGSIVSVLGYGIEEFNLPMTYGGNNNPDCNCVSVIIENTTVSYSADKAAIKYAHGQDSHDNWSINFAN